MTKNKVIILIVVLSIIGIAFTAWRGMSAIRTIQDGDYYVLGEDRVPTFTSALDMRFKVRLGTEEGEDFIIAKYEIKQDRRRQDYINYLVANDNFLVESNELLIRESVTEGFIVVRFSVYEQFMYIRVSREV